MITRIAIDGAPVSEHEQAQLVSGLRALQRTLRMKLRQDERNGYVRPGDMPNVLELRLLTVAGLLEKFPK